MTQALLGVAVGLGLAAACGFRVFLPLFGMSLASISGHLTVGADFAWVATTPAAIALGTATALEIGAYYVPWLDHLLDVLATPAAVVAGVITAAAVVIDLPPILRWGIAVIGGGGAAGFVQGATVLVRTKSGLATGGLANPVVATLEVVGGVTTVMLALVVPVVCLALLVLTLGAGAFRLRRRPNV
jgi:hypothetical protein